MGRAGVICVLFCRSQVFGVLFFKDCGIGGIWVFGVGGGGLGCWVLAEGVGGGFLCGEIVRWCDCL